jgi:Mg/Co/Ni transporter MgtE
MDEETAAEVLAELDQRLTTQIVERMDRGKAADILEEMAPDEAADLLADLPKQTSEEVLHEMPGEEAAEVRELLAFDPTTAGGMMNTEFLFMGETLTRDEALAYMRKEDVNLEQLDTIILVNQEAKFAGAVPVARLLLATAAQTMGELQSEPLLAVDVREREDDIFELFDKYNLRMLTVVDAENHPIGVITVDDVVSRLVKK